MLAKAYSMGLLGVDGFSVTVEADITGGLPAFDIVGLPDAAVKESKERIRSGVKNSGFIFPSKKLIINLAPASLRKEGPGYDLPIAVAVLAATGQIPMPKEDTACRISRSCRSRSYRFSPAIKEKFRFPQSWYTAPPPVIRRTSCT